jgi:8-amino-7-oxononanoate synthase
VPALGLQDLVWARIVAFGKAFASNGAMVLGSRTLKAYLVNFARSFIYTTAPAEAGLRWLQGVYREMPNLQTARSQLEKLARNAAELFPQAAPASPGLPAHLAWSPILPLPIADLARLPHLRSQLQAAQIDLRPILPPTVPTGQAIWRVNLHSHNTLAELQTLADILG